MKHLYFGFYAPYFAKDGRLHPEGWFGHCEVWGYEDDTWTFIDPLASGLMIRSVFKHDDVMDQLNARFALCDTILRMEAPGRQFLFPLHGMMTCAAICGSLVGIRALLPATLHRKLVRAGAEKIHDAERRSSGSCSAPA